VGILTCASFYGRDVPTGNRYIKIICKSFFRYARSESSSAGQVAIGVFIYHALAAKYGLSDDPCERNVEKDGASLFVVARARDLKNRSLAQAVIHRRRYIRQPKQNRNIRPQANLCPSRFDTFASDSQVNR
jgi:hypothetical protein